MRRWVAVLLAFALVLSTPFDAEAQKRKSSKKSKPKSASQLRGDLGAIKRRKAQIRSQLAKAKHQTNVVKHDIRNLDANLERLQDSLSQTKTSLNRNRAQQRSLEGQLEDATKRVATVKDQVRKRLRHMYLHQGESVLSAFVSSGSIGEIASRKVLLEAIARKDRALFNEFRELRAKVSDRKRRKDQVVARIADLKERQVDYQAHLEIKREDKADALKDLRNKQAQLRSLLAQLAQDEASVYSQIRAYEAARRRRKPGSRPGPVFTGRFMKPANGPITSRYGMRMHPVLRYRRLHAGVDIGARSGSPIYAAGDGEVIASQYSRSYGNMVILDHGKGVSTLYAHASRIYVRAGATVRRGQVIGAVGSTGLSSGPHLHWEVRVNGRTVNPLGRF